MASDMTRHLDEDEKGTRLVRTPGGEQEIATVTEAGMYRAIVTRQTGRMADPARRETIRAFQRWVTHEVLPAIRRTGTYSTRPQPQLSEDEIVHQALQITARRVEQLEADLAKALPKANTWDALCSGRGDHSITDAAKLLSSAGITTGPRKLHKQLQDLGWVHKNQRDKWAANQDKLNTGLLAEKVRHYIDDDGVSVLATPQVRVTPKGLEKLHELLTPAGLQEVLA
nr:MAG TPA: antirepressor protein [Caudoviricetes sp.]